jgi:hypothetical protein
VSYFIIEVGCIECNGGGQSEPKLVESYETFALAEKAVSDWDAEDYHGSSDRFILNSTSGEITQPQHSKDR